MRPGRQGMPPENRAVAPVEIEAYLEYARENIERSRMLFEKGDLRYAVFSANEGLELCVKAHMLHYGIIDKAVAAGHFPYPAIIKKMAEVTKSNVQHNPSNKRQMEEALESLDTPEVAFDIMKKKELQIPLWKFSLNISLSDDEMKHLDKFQEKLSVWNQEMARIKIWRDDPHEQCHGRRTHGKQAESSTTVSSTRRDKSGRCGDSPSGLLPEKETTPHDRVVGVERLFAMLPLIFLLDVISLSFAHQQISRYPTQIDGIDSRTVYIKHKDDVKSLLERIYGASEMLSYHLRHGDPLLMEYAASMGVDMRELTSP